MSGLPVGVLPLFPFQSASEVAAFEKVAASQLLYLDAGATALAFARMLGFGDATLVTSKTVSGGDAHVGVGFRPVDGSTVHNPVTMAVVHLVKWGTASTAPWEVVGTADTTLELTRPAYGSSVSSPAVVGGSITGVDESISLQVRILAAKVGSYCCLAAGGTDTPWQATVKFSAPSGSVVTIVAATGGHVAAVERFSVTGVRAA